MRIESPSNVSMAVLTATSAKICLTESSHLHAVEGREAGEEGLAHLRLPFAE